MIGFCYYCGTGPIEEIGDYFHCTICEAVFRIAEVKEPQLTLEEAEATFNKIPLTDKKALFAKKRNERKSKTDTKII